MAFGGRQVHENEMIELVRVAHPAERTICAGQIHNLLCRRQDHGHQFHAPGVDQEQVPFGGRLQSAGQELRRAEHLEGRKTFRLGLQTPFKASQLRRRGCSTEDESMQRRS
jgi:hypothetical protein